MFLNNRAVTAPSLAHSARKRLLIGQAIRRVYVLIDSSICDCHRHEVFGQIGKVQIAYDPSIWDFDRNRDVTPVDLGAVG
jgi:hypothetical protein